jgi:putative ubiquitin-RnfH superfamily antitoxin RatB of RatAB toxin-antitoxin module
MIQVRILWAKARALQELLLEVPPGTTIEDLLGLFPKDHPMVSALAETQAWSEFGRPITAQTPLLESTEIALLCPLKADPKAARRQRVNAIREQRHKEGNADRWTKHR